MPINVHTGCQGSQKFHANIHNHAKTTKKRPLTREQKRVTRQINSLRVFVVHTSRRVKVVRRLGERYRTR